MKKISVIGLDTDKEKVMSDMMVLGAVQMTESKKKSEADELTGAPISLGEDSAAAALDLQINDVALALETLEKYSPEKSPLFFTRRAIRRADFDKTLKAKNAIMGNVRGILKLRDDLHRQKEARNKKVTDLNAVMPWIVYDLPLNETETEYTDIDLGVLPSTVDLDALRERLEDIDQAVVLKEINRDRDFIYVVVMTLKECTEKILTGLKQSGYTQAAFVGFDGTASQNKEEIEKAISEKQREIKQTEAKITGRYGEKKDIECLHDQLIIDRDREIAKDNLMKTRRTFSFEGWIPEPAIEPVCKALDKYGCYYEYRDPEEDEDVPILTRNNKFAYPFESITEMYSLPDYRGVDPTSYFAIFYAMFFGIMLSDAGYGIVITLATYIILKKFDLEGMTYKMIKMFFYCGIATIFWGALFGGWFGDFVHVAGQIIFHKDWNVPPIWFNPIEDPTKLLIFSLALGIIHMFLGMGIKAKMLIKSGHWFDAVCDIFSWYMVIIGAVLWIAGGKVGAGAVMTGKVLVIIGALILLLFGGRKKKGFGKVIGGLGAIYNVTGYASDILSYSRLLALGLATGVIAQVVNTIGALAGPGIKGTIVLLLVFVIGHTFNLGINALGAFVHTSRLQYIEFFGKFYEDGGEEFEPFRKNTKYVRLTEDTMEVEND